MLRFSSISLGSFAFIWLVCVQIIEPCGYDAEVASLASGAMLLFGLIGAGIMSILMEKTKAYSLLQKSSVVLASGGMLFMLASLQRDKEVQIIASFGFLGLCLIPLLPVNLESAAETTFPVPEDNSAAVLLSAGNTMGIAYIFVLPPLLSLNPSADCGSIWSWFALFVSNIFLSYLSMQWPWPGHFLYFLLADCRHYVCSRYFNVAV